MLYCVVPHNSLVAIWLDEKRESAAAEKNQLSNWKLLKMTEQSTRERARDNERKKDKNLSDFVRVHEQQHPVFSAVVKQTTRNAP